MTEITTAPVTTMASVGTASVCGSGGDAQVEGLRGGRDAARNGHH